VPRFPAEVLERFASQLFEAAGVPADEAAVVARSLVGANLRGHDSHGLMRVPQYLGFVAKGEYRPGAALVVEHETPAAVVCDAQWGFGQVQAHRLLDHLVPKARALGVAAGAARHCGHIGRLGEYAERAAESGLILMATVNNCGAGQRVAPPGGTAPRLGTNPLCVGVPTGSDPVVLDFGTSVVAEGKVRVYHINGQPVPAGWLLDRDGQPTTDPSVLYEQPSGSILPMGGTQAYKGFGLALVLDMLASGLSGGRTCFQGAPAAKGNNVLFVLFDPEGFAGRDAMAREAGGLSAFVRETPRAAGVEAILLPGDPELIALRERSRAGVPLAEAHWERLVEAAATLGVDPPSPPPSPA
jgi:uncharacterized oxidoreductase